LRLSAPRANLLFQEVGPIEPEARNLGKENVRKNQQSRGIRCEVATSYSWTQSPRSSRSGAESGASSIRAFQGIACTIRIELLSYNLYNKSWKTPFMSAVTSREVIHNFSAVAARVAAGEEITVTRYGKPVLKLVQVSKPEMTAQEREAHIRKILAIRMTGTLGGQFERNEAFDD
jgi:antitoxin (DNA-binding transcriptional repressor) of toxin-antitoxin stability system